MRQACGRSAAPTPSASSMRKVEKAIAVERPSKVGASWAENGWVSTSTGFSPPWAAARAKVAPASPAPAMMTSWRSLWIMRRLSRRGPAASSASGSIREE